MRPTNTDDEADWLRLIRSENVGPRTFQQLLERFGSAGAALDALPELAARGGAKRPIKVAPAAVVERELKRAAQLGIRHIFMGTADYPALLTSIHAPPPVIMVRGDVALIQRPGIALVGARRASTGGKTLARQFAERFGAAGVMVVSGLAVGIDAAAHRAALPTGTTAVLAGGVDRPTPPDNEGLAEEIAASGALVSEMPLGAIALPRDYPRRNRLIAGLSLAVVLVEAGERSGALYTAQYGLDAGRDIFAVPGSPLDPRVAGCIRLLREGASLAAHPDDVLSAVFEAGAARNTVSQAEMALSAPQADAGSPPPPREVSAERLDTLLEAISSVPTSINALVRDTALPVAVLRAALVELELAGRIEWHPDGKVSMLQTSDRA